MKDLGVTASDFKNAISSKDLEAIKEWLFFYHTVTAEIIAKKFNLSLEKSKKAIQLLEADELLQKQFPKRPGWYIVNTLKIKE